MTRDVIFEFRRIGTVVKVSAVDTLTMTEVSIMGPASATEATLRQTALRKLEFVLAQRAKGHTEPRR
jgi:hypothetical protein